MDCLSGPGFDSRQLHEVEMKVCESRLFFVYKNLEEKFIPMNAVISGTPGSSTFALRSLWRRRALLL
jgi:hypothetical protein